MKNFDLHSLKIRKMTINDLDELSNLEKEIFPNPWSKESLRYEMVDRVNSIAFKIVLNDKIIAYTFSWLITNEFHIGNFAVVEEFRKRGIGEYFLKFIIEKAKELGAGFCYLEVRKNNIPAIKLYEKFGFKIIGDRKEYYSDNQEDAYVMGLNI